MYEQLMGELGGCGGVEGLRPSDLLGLPDGLRGLVTWLTRRGDCELADLVAHVGCAEPDAANLALALVGRGMLSVDPEGKYRVRLAGRRPRPAQGPKL